MLHITKTFMSVSLDTATRNLALFMQGGICVCHPGTVPLPPDKLHVTLCSFGSLKPYRDRLKTLVTREGEFQAPPGLRLEEQAQLQTIPNEDPEKVRWSWACRLKDQEVWHAWRRNLLVDMGLPEDLDPGRVFHLSLANKDGSPFSSVGPAFEEGTELGEIVTF